MTSSSPAPTERVVIRPARAGDLRAAAAIYAVSDVAEHRRMHPLSGMSESDVVAMTEGAFEDIQFLHAEASRQVWVAEIEEIVGMAAAAIRGRHWHLTYLFVAPHVQAQGIGGELLRQIHDAGREAGCTVFTLQASDDPRALTRYFRLGLFPHAPTMVWSATDPTFPALGLDNRLEATPLRHDDTAALNTVADIDKAVRGVERLDDVRRWLEEGATGDLLTDRENGKPAGYFLVSIDSGKGRIGPVAAIDESSFGGVLTNGLAAAATRHVPGSAWELALPGENRAAVPVLLAAGFRPRYGMIFFASAPIGRFDRYVFHDVDLL